MWGGPGGSFRWVPAVLAASVLLAAPGAAHAATITVNTTSDVVANDGACSLREAVMSADADNATTGGAGGCVTGSGTDTIVIPAGTYQLTRAGTPAPADPAFNDLDITAPVTITGAGASATTIDASGLDRAFTDLSVLTLNDVTITGGRPHSVGGAEDGGAIRAIGSGALFVKNCAFVDNRAQDGNAGQSQTAAATAAATGQAGQAGGRGGAIYSTVGLSVTGSRFERNASGAGGAGGEAHGGDGTNNPSMDQSTINGGPGTAGNGGAGGNGGAIYAGQGATIADTSFAANAAGAGGDGGAATGGAGGTAIGPGGGFSLTFGNGGNATGGGGALGGEGGAVYVAAGSSQVSGTTFSANATGAGGAGGAATGGSAQSTPGFGTEGAGGTATGGLGGHGGDGGALVTDAASRPITLFASTFSQNDAASGGGGGTGTGGDGFLANFGVGGAGYYGGSGGAVEVGAGGSIANVTFASNAAGDAGAGGTGASGSGNPFAGTTGGAGGIGGSGGAVDTAGPGTSTTIAHSTFNANVYGSGGAGGGGAGGVAGSGGDGGALDRIYGSVSLRANAFVANQPSSCWQESTPGTISDLGANVRSGKIDGSCPSTAGTIKLGPLQDNGGPVPTLALVAGDVAIDEVPAGGCPATDARGAARPFGSGCDAGAYELTPPAASTGPAKNISTAGATLTGTVNAHGPAGSLHFEYGRTTSYGSRTPSQALGTGFADGGASASIGGLAHGAVIHYRVVVATDDGTATGADATFTVGKPGSSTGGGSGTRTSGGSDHTPPRLSQVTMTATRFAVSDKPTAKVAAAAVVRGTIFRLRLSERATVRFTITRTVKHACRKGSNRRCTRTATAGILTRRRLKPGKHSVAFSGRIGDAALKPARYRVTITATDVAGNRSKSTGLSFTIVRG